MARSMSAQRAAIVSQGMHVVPVRRWHPTGHQISILSSLFIAVAIGVFFIAMQEWTPSPEWQVRADFAVTWILLTYIWVQLLDLVVDLGVSVLLSRQVVDVGTSGVG